MKILVAGCGSIGKRHIRNLRSMQISEILAFDPWKERLAQISREFAVTPCSEIEAALRQSPSLAIVAGPNHLHLTLARAFLENGCDVFIEKPIAHLWRGAEELLELARKKGRLVAVGYQLRHHPGLRQVRDWIAGGAIGKVLSARVEVGQFLPDWHPWEDYRKGYSARADMGGGVALDSSHELDLMLWMLGKPSSVWAAVERAGSLEIDVEDLVEITARYHDRALATARLDYLSRPVSREGRLLGTSGSIRWDLAAKTLRLFSAAEGRWETFDHLMQVEPNDMYVAEMKDILSCFAERRTPLADGEAGLSALRFALLAKQSANLGKELPWETPLS